MISSPSDRDSASRHLHFICYRWGTPYGVEYVNILRAMVARHLTLPHTFHCMTDDPAGLHGDIVVHRLPDPHFNGNWNKLMTFKPDFLGLQGRLIVSLDLDLVILGNIDFLADDPGDDFKICGRNWVKGGHRGNGSVYRVRVGTQTQVWERFIEDPAHVRDTFGRKMGQGGEQAWLNNAVENYSYFPDEKIVSYKRHCNAKGRVLFGAWGERAGLTSAVFGCAEPPPGAAIVAFHGKPLPPDIMSHRCGRWRKAPFVAAHWHE